MIEDYLERANGKYFVLGVDRFDDEDFFGGSFDTPQEAIEYAREKTKEAMPYASDASIATVYYAYNPQGGYIGGDAWEEPDKQNAVQDNSIISSIDKLCETIDKYTKAVNDMRDELNNAKQLYVK
ncbi:MAG: hypothetical protein ACP5N3_03595 [Candidatus Nanoarchaeia archaeon]